MRPEGDEATDTVPAKQPLPLQYAPARARRGLKFWASRFLARLGKPMPLGMYFVIMFVLSAVATLLAVILAAVVRAVR